MYCKLCENFSSFFSKIRKRRRAHFLCCFRLFSEIPNSFYWYVLFIYRHHIFYDWTSDLIYHIGIFKLYITVITIYISNIDSTRLLIPWSTILISCRYRNPVCFIQTIFCKIFYIIICTLGKWDGSPSACQFGPLFLFLISRSLTVLCYLYLLKVSTADRWQCVVLRQRWQVEYKIRYFVDSAEHLSGHPHPCACPSVPQLLVKLALRYCFPDRLVLLFPYLGIPYPSE